MSVPTRRRALALLAALAPASAWAARPYGDSPARVGVYVDVSPLRAAGDRVDADYLEAVLPGLLARSVGPGHTVRARIDDVNYSTPGGNGVREDGTVDTIQGVGWIDGKEIRVFSALQGSARLPDVGGYEARNRQELLARSFAEWLPRLAGL